MPIFDNFVQKIDFEGSKFQQMGVALDGCYLSELSSFWVLGEGYLKASKVPLDEYCYHWNVTFC